MNKLSKSTYRSNVIPIKSPMVFFTELEQKHFKSEWKAFLGGPEVKTTCQCRGHGFQPCSGKIPHAVKQLRPRATAIELVLRGLGATTWDRVPQPGAQSSCSATGEATSMKGPQTQDSSICLPQLEKARVQHQRRSTAKN